MQNDQYQLIGFFFEAAQNNLVVISNKTLALHAQTINTIISPKDTSLHLFPFPSRRSSSLQLSVFGSFGIHANEPMQS